MTVNACLIVLAAIYAAFLLLGLFFFKLTARLTPFSWRLGNKALNLCRFLMYVLLLPAGLTCATAIFVVWFSEQPL